MSGDEKRKKSRNSMLADIIIEHKSQEIYSVAYNISQSGLYFVTSGVFDKGNICLITLRDRGKSFYRRKGIIKWSKMIETRNKMISYGLEFKKPISEKEICLFLDYYK